MNAEMEPILHQLTIAHSPMRSAIGRAILMEKLTDAIITDICEHSSWNVYYGICHAMHLLSETPEDAAMFKELRSYFMYKHRRMDEVMFTGKMNTKPIHSRLWQD